MRDRINTIIVAVMLVAVSVSPCYGKITIGGYVGDRISSCINNRVKPQDIATLAEPFRHLTEGTLWQSEFMGKWMLGAIASYRYNSDPELLAKIGSAAEMLMSTQHPDGYIGNYKEEDRLKCWDIWGRKYTSLALLDYYRLTGDKKALKAVCGLIDCLIAELDRKGMDIADTGLYRGMPSCSILEPVVYLYNITHDRTYLEFAKNIAASIEKDGHPQLVGKALCGVPVAHRYAFPKEWWAFENGHKAYEMMSCYVGLMELGKTIDAPVCLEAAEAVAKNIIDTEINIAGSGAAFECWYDGRVRQTVPAYHTMETCVTFTWMQLLDKLWQQTGNSMYADEFERTMYNALMAALRADGKEISKYSPLEGRRQPGEEQCGLPINCCNANGPRGFALIPEFALVAKNDTAYINLYLPLDGELEIGKSALNIGISNDFPRDGKNRIEIVKQGKGNAVVALRIPGWCGGKYSISVNGNEIAPAPVNGYVNIPVGTGATTIQADFNLVSRVEKLNGMQALVRGPILFARDSRFGDGYIDECGVIKENGDGEVETRIVESPGFAWITAEVPVVLGTDLENPSNASGRTVRFCDFGSAGNDWNPDGRYRVWIVSPLNAMSQPYHKY